MDGHQLTEDETGSSLEDVESCSPGEIYKI